MGCCWETSQTDCMSWQSSAADVLVRWDMPYLSDRYIWTFSVIGGKNILIKDLGPNTFL